MILQTKDIVGAGAYAEIFRQPGDVVVCKLFINGTHQTNARQGLNRPEDEVRRKQTFDSQCTAYQLAGKDPYLRLHVPRFHGACRIQDVHDASGKSVAHRYLLAHCYAIDYVGGSETKLGGLEQRFEHIRNAEGVFRSLGIRHLIDASVFAPEDPVNFKFIDFAMEEFEVFW